MTLQSDTIDVWQFDLGLNPIELAQFESILSRAEIERANRYKFEHLRTGYIKRRGITRYLAGQYLDINPSVIQIHYTEFQKPYFPDHSLFFNMSYSGNDSVIGFSKTIDIGIDIEQIKTDFDVQKLADRFFSKDESNIIKGLNGSEQYNAFYKCWTRKEAIIKAHGAGLSIPLDSFSVSILDTESVQLKKINWENELVKDWNLHSFIPTNNTLAALSYKGVMQEQHHRVITADILARR